MRGNGLANYLGDMQCYDVQPCQRIGIKGVTSIFKKNT